MAQMRHFVGLVFLVLGAILLPHQSAAAGADEEPDAVRYDGHKVVRTVLTSRRQVRTMLEISPDVWSEGIGLGLVDFRIPPDRMDDLDRSGIGYEILIDDVQALIDRERDTNDLPMQPGGGNWFSDYKTYDDVMFYLDTLTTINPGIAQTINVGTSLEGRAIRGLRIGAGADRPVMVIHGCQHAREWIAVMTPMFIADALIRNYGSDPGITDLVDRVEFIIIPIVNPDGYDYTWNVDRLWRKNRRNNGDGSFGVDLNRNWGWGWGGEGSSGNTTSQTYRGTGPFSEPESSALRDLILNEPRTGIHLDIHSYGQVLLSPWGNTADLPPDHDRYTQLSAAMSSLIQSIHSSNYNYGPAYSTLYPASGIAPDWGYGERGALGYTFELRDTGQHGFVLPAEQIIPTGEEILPAVLLLASELTRVIEFAFPDGLPAIIEPETPTPAVVEIRGVNGYTLDAGSPRLFARLDGENAFSESTLTPLGGDRYEALLPAAPCGRRIEFYFAAQTTSGEGATSPEDAPATTYESHSIRLETAFNDDFQTDRGWTVENVDLTDGAWQRAVPAGGGDRGDPVSDFDGSGACYVTDNADGNSDVDGGPTRLISPRLDLSAHADPVVSYARWMTNDDQDIDRLETHVSNDDGSTWVFVDSVNNTGGWEVHRFNLGDFITLNDRVRIRFSVTDNPNDSVTEAAIDAFAVTSTYCDSATLADFEFVFGSHVSGVLADLLASDDLYVRGRSQFGFSAMEANALELIVGAVTDAASPSTIDLSIESKLDHPDGLVRVRLRNWSTGSLDQVHAYNLGTTETIEVISGIDATNRIRDPGSDGRIEVSIRQSVIASFSLAGFVGTFDHVSVHVE